jgi:hypothetical protein
MTKRKIHQVWRNMMCRCYRKEHTSYEYYGGRSIKVCEEWHTFEPFYKWALANGYSDNLTIDRIDVNSNYEPSNCRWATQKEQANNRRNNHLFTYNGETKTISEWAESLGITHQALEYRLRSPSWTIAEALTIKSKARLVEQPSFRKPIYQKSIDNELIKKWGSTSEAAKALKIHNENITRALNNPRYTAGGFCWEYANFFN